MKKIIKENKYFIFDTPVESNLKSKIKNIYLKIKSIAYKCKLNIFVPKRKDKTKYNVSICGIFKNEGLYLKEWIEFHKIVGVEHFYLYNNNSDDNFMQILNPYIQDGTVTLVEWKKNQAQMEAYHDCIAKFAKETQWLGFIDIDEFVVPKSTNNIYDFLKKFNKNRASVLIYWKMFGSSGKIDRDLNGLVINDLVVSWPKHSNIGKCFLNTKYQVVENDKNKSLHHLMWARYKNTDLPPVNCFDKVVLPGYNIASNVEFPIQINHYFSKTYEEYRIKKAKGDVYFKINPHDEEYFYHHEQNNSTVDYSIYKYLIKLKNNLKKK